jgi:hypothetical protein
MKTTFFFAAACVLSSAIHAAEWIAGSYKQPVESDEAAFFALARNNWGGTLKRVIISLVILVFL